jgi:Flp pilus assembly protein TadG
MKPRLQERGQALILIAFAVVGLFGFSALAIDGSRVFSDRRHAQNAADTAALAAALARVRAASNPSQAAIDAATVSAGLDRAASNGYTNDADSTVEVHMCNETGLNPPCEGLPGGANLSEYIQVKIVSTIPTTFARIIGRQQVTSVLTAIARAKSGLPTPLFNGAALAALKPNGTNTLGGNGNITLDVNNSGTFNNSTDNCGMNLVGNGNYSVDTAFEVVSQYCAGNNTHMNGPAQSAGQIPYPPAITIPIPSISCSGNGSSSNSIGADGIPTTTFSPGNYGSINLNSTGHVHFSPGNYCFNGGVSINGTANIIANSVKFLITSGEFRIGGSSTFTCNDMLVHITGGSGMHFNGNGGNFCNSVTFIASQGDVTWNGNVTNRFFAPTGGTYKNVLIYMPYLNNAALTINGNSGNMLTGSIIAVSSNITISGNSGTTGLHSQIIGYTVALQGNSNTTINYVPGEQYAQVDPSGIQLTK